MLRLIVLLLALLTLSGCSVAMKQQTVRPDQLTYPPLQFTFPTVEQRQLDNGMKLFIKEDNELPLVQLSLTLAGGSIHDPLNKAGLSQLFAATLESGGAGPLSPTALEQELEARAIQLSVAASSYSYQIDLSLHHDDLERGLEILQELLQRPRFDPQRFELARQQLLARVYRQNDDPEAIAGRLLAEATAPGHPFGVVPSVASVNAIKRDDLLQLQQRWLQPDNIWLAVSGDVSRNEMIGLLNWHFHAWRSVAQPDKPLPSLPAEAAEQVWLVDKDLPQTTILLGQRGINKDNPDMYALQVANFILGGGSFNSRLMREIRSNRGLAYSVYSYFRVGRRLPELFIASSETKSESTFEVVQLMLEQLRKLAAEPVTETELALAKESLINSFVFAFEDSHAVVSRKVRLQFYDYPPDYMQRWRENMAAVTIADVQRVARKYLQPEHLQIILVGRSDDFADQLEQLGLPLKRVAL